MSGHSIAKSALTQQQRNSLAAICRTLCPNLHASNGESPELYGHSADFFNVSEQIERRLERASSAERNGFRRILDTIERPTICAAVTGFTTPFSKLDQFKREEVLRRWRSNWFPQLRRFFQSIKRLTLFLCYASLDQDGSNPTWSAIGYTGKNSLPANPDSFDSLKRPQIEQGRLGCDFLVIGSGAGGSVAASKLAARGFDVLVVEKGISPARSKLGDNEIIGNRHLFDKTGSLTSRDLGVIILAGSTLGGGTTINWMTCLRTPIDVKQQWADQFGVAAAISPEFERCTQEVLDRLNVNTNESIENQQNQLLRKGCEQIGASYQKIARNVVGCGDCGFCNYGCRSGAKQDTRQTYLLDAVKHGARIVDGCKVVQLKTSSNRVHGAVAALTTTSNDGKSTNQTQTINIDCEAVVLAGGAIQTPALLLRSGIKGKHIGRNLHLHPTTAIGSFFDEPVFPWQGPPQTIMCDQAVDNDGFGVRLETAPVHPGFGAMALAWDSGRQHKQWMQKLKHLANIVIICRDKNSGSVRVDSSGRIVVNYRLGTAETSNLVHGSQLAATVHRAAGANTIVGPFQTPVVFERGDSFAAFSEQLSRAKTNSNSISLFSAHQMSSCRIAVDPANGATDLTGRIFGYDNLFVADGSCLPSSCGVNPMITIMSLSALLSEQWDIS